MDVNIKIRNFGLRAISRPVGFLIIAWIEIIKAKSGTQLAQSTLEMMSFYASFPASTADGPSAIHSRRSLLVVTPPMYCLDIVRVIVPPRSAHSFRMPMVGDHVVIVRELLVADRANASLFSDLSVKQLPHLGR